MALSGTRAPRLREMECSSVCGILKGSTEVPQVTVGAMSSGIIRGVGVKNKEKGSTCSQAEIPGKYHPQMNRDNKNLCQVPRMLDFSPGPWQRVAGGNAAWHMTHPLVFLSSSCKNRPVGVLTAGSMGSTWTQG